MKLDVTIGAPSLDVFLGAKPLDVDTGTPIVKEYLPLRDYELLDNLPRINGVTLVGDKTAEELGLDVETFMFTQSSASAIWDITHNLGRRPSVTVVDSAGTVVVGDVQYLSDDRVVCSFTGAFSGQAYLN